MRVVFMGTPEFAVPSLEALVQAGHMVTAVITQPDRPAGRGKKLQPPPVKQKALELGLEVFQPERVRRDEGYDYLVAQKPDVIAVVGYGQLLPQRILDIARHGCVNVHSSLLPQYRGAAPMNWAIVNGETVSGVSTMKLVLEMDAGDVLLARETPIGENETAPELSARLAPMGAELLVETLAGLDAGTITPTPQDPSNVSYAPIMKREDGLIDWSRSARELHDRARGFDPWPGAYTEFRGKRLHIRRTRVSDGSAAPGAMALEDGRVLIGCGGGGRLEALEVQVEGKKRMPALDFWHGYSPKPDERLG